MALQLSTKDTAEFLRWTLKLGWSAVPDVVCWVESLIESSDEPADWMLDFGWNKSAYADEIDLLLDKIPGMATDDLPRKLAAALIGRRWLDHRCDDAQLSSVWCKLYPEFPRTAETDHAADVWQYLDEVLLNLVYGGRTYVDLSTAHAQLAKRLEKYHEFLEPAERLLAELRRRASLSC
ncbi:MAG: hypothetical protein QM775_29865 [Pirellulales bacterium]